MALLGALTATRLMRAEAAEALTLPGAELS
jgi:hypothetical protein